MEQYLSLTLSFIDWYLPTAKQVDVVDVFAVFWLENNK